MTHRDQDLSALSPDELLALPDSAICNLTEYFSLRAAHRQEANAEELVRERTGASRSRRMFGGADAPDEETRQAEEKRELRAREDRLLQAIMAEEREIEKRREEIDSRAIRLGDGRLVYTDGDEYRDGQGHRLEGRDRDEADAGRRGNSATWAEREENERQQREAERLRREIEENMRQKPQERDTNLGAYEHQFTEDFGKDKARIEAGQVDYSTDLGDLTPPQPAETIASRETISKTQIPPKP